MTLSPRPLRTIFNVPLDSKKHYQIGQKLAVMVMTFVVIVGLVVVNSVSGSSNCYRLFLFTNLYFYLLSAESQPVKSA